MKPIVTGALAAIAVVSLAGNFLMYERYSSSRPLVVVGKTVISRKNYQDQLNYQTQGAVLKKMVFAALVDDAAAKQGVMPSDADVKAQLADIQRRDPQLLASVNNDPAKMADFTTDLKTSMALDNLRIKDVQVSDADVAAFYAQHKAQFALPLQVQTAMVIADTPVDAATAAALLRQNIGLDVIGRQPRLHVVGMNGFTVNMQALPAAQNKTLSAAVYSMKPGDVKIVPLGQYTAVLKANKFSAAQVPPLTAIRPQVIRQAKLAKAVPPGVEIASLYQSAPPKFYDTAYQAYFSDVSSVDVAAATKAVKTASVK